MRSFKSGAVQQIICNAWHRYCFGSSIGCYKGERFINFNKIAAKHVPLEGADFAAEMFGEWKKELMSCFDSARIEAFHGLLAQAYYAKVLTLILSDFMNAS